MIINEDELYKKLKSLNTNNEIYEISQAKDGAFSLKYTINECTFYVSSKYSPINEGKKFAETNITENKNIFIYGLGMGYHIKSMLELMNENQKLYILECNMLFIKLAFDNTEIKEVLNNPKIEFMGTDNLNEAVLFSSNTFKNEDINIIIHESSLRSMPESLITLKDLFGSFNIRTKSNKKMSSLLIENEKYNLSKGYPNGGHIFKDKYKNIPAIVVSAGPSMLDCFDILRNNASKAIVIAVGRSSHTLAAKKIRADYYIQTDPQNLTNYYVNKSDPTIPLFFLSTASYLLEEYPGDKYILFEKYSVPESEKPYTVEAGGSVATTALSLAKLMGCNPICLIGQDLAYHKERMHAGVRDKYNKLKINKYVEGIDGKQCYTSQNLYEYLKWFERYAEKNKDINLINCTSYGAKIHGMLHQSLDKALSGYPELDKKNILI